MTKKDLFLHTDCESATLRAHTGKLWQIGIVTTLADYSSPNSELFANQAEFTQLPHTDCWDKETLNWAIKTYGEEFFNRCWTEGMIDYRNIWTSLANSFDSYVGRIVASGYTPHLICNHTDFDVTFLKVMYDKLDRKFPIKYNRIWDMPSMLVASTRMSMPDVWSAIGIEKAQVAHTALADAIAQMEVLKRYNVYLPISSKG